MNQEATTPKGEYSLTRRILCYALHLYTASGIFFAVLILMAIINKDYKWAYLWMVVATVIDSSDGYLARKLEVKKVLPHINGGDLDNIVDYVNYTFLPLFLIAHAGLIPQPAWLWVSLPMMASLFGFANADAKQAEEGFFLGFPSYWNFVAIYVQIVMTPISPYFSLAVLMILTVLTVSPLRFAYPSRMPRFQKTFIWGAILWTISFVAIIVLYPIGEKVRPPMWLALASISYPLFYCLFSMYLDFDARRRKKNAA
ncbi:MAG: CDP-alcohol phosphatidyltransferase family protein [Myxococcales bacterium]|nr:CDP-alcohol phosphatidyltransferase family protein [Myxococcales bacterium]